MKTDIQIKNDVIAELRWTPKIDQNEIGVTVKNGIVDLLGYVKSYDEKRAAEKAALRVAGVKGVANDIEVKLLVSFIKTDPELAEAAVNALTWNMSVPEDNLKVKADNGWVTLTGEVEWNFQKEAAYKAVSKLAGVRGVTNLITVKPRIDAQDVKRELTAAFHRNASLEAKNIDVDVIGNKVILQGTLPTWTERKEAEDAAWAAPGVLDVDNRIAIGELVETY